MTSPLPFGKYSSISSFSIPAPSWAPPAHQPRLSAYALYEQIYWSHVDTTYKLMNRGLDGEDQPLYVPSSRIIIDTMNRYVGTGMTYAIDPETGTDATQLLARQVFQTLFARERFSARYTAAKRHNLLTQGDMVWHVMADPLKPEGARLSLVPVKPESYFPTTEDEITAGGDPNHVVQVRLVELITEGDTILARVQLYDRSDDGPILSSLTLWKQDEWFNPEKSPVQVIVPPTPLPPQITAMPVYHVPNGSETGELFGSSELRGLETLQAALNQSNTDEDIAVAMMGLGVFATDSPGSPVTPDGTPRGWFLYPGAVIEDAKGLRRLDGITTLAPYTEHIGRIEGYLADASGATDAARGRIEVTEAESGVALQLRLGPTLAKAAEKDLIIQDVHAQLFYDLVNMWLPTFEGVNVTDVRVFPQFGDKLPVNRKAEAEIISNLMIAGIVSAGSARRYLGERGFDGLFDVAEAELILAEKVATAAAEGADPAQDRQANELTGQSALNSPPVEDDNANA